MNDSAKATSLLELVSPLIRTAAGRKASVEYNLPGFIDGSWPARGAVWDGLGVTTTGAALLVEAKAHIPEAASPASKASPQSLAHIQRSLAEAHKAYAPRSSADWAGSFYQYANGSHSSASFALRMRSRAS